MSFPEKIEGDAADGLLAQFSTVRDEVTGCYKRFVAVMVGMESIWNNLNRQIYLGNDQFVAICLPP
jgi:hypothetical protein